MSSGNHYTNDIQERFGGAEISVFFQYLNSSTPKFSRANPNTWKAVKTQLDLSVFHVYCFIKATV